MILDNNTASKNKDRKLNPDPKNVDRSEADEIDDVNIDTEYSVEPVDQSSYMKKNASGTFNDQVLFSNGIIQSETSDYDISKLIRVNFY